MSVKLLKLVHVLRATVRAVRHIIAGLQIAVAGFAQKLMNRCLHL